MFSDDRSSAGSGGLPIRWVDRLLATVAAHDREFVAGVVMAVALVLSASVGAGTFGEFLVPAVAAGLIALFGVGGRRWIAVVAFALVPFQYGRSAMASGGAPDAYAGWLVPDAIDGWQSMLPYAIAMTLPMAVLLLAWAYGFGRTRTGVLATAALGLTLYSARIVVSADNAELLQASGAAGLVLALSGPVAFLGAVWLTRLMWADARFHLVPGTAVRRAH